MAQQRLQLAQQLVADGTLHRGQAVVLVSGRHPGVTGGTDTIKVRVVD